MALPSRLTTAPYSAISPLRDTLVVAKGTAREELERLALTSDKVQRALEGAEVKKVIVVPDRLVNVVA